MFVMFVHPSKCVFAIALVLALAAGSVTSEAQQPSATALATAKELITVKGGRAIYEPIVPGVIEQARRVLLQTNPTLSKPMNEVAAALRAEYASRTDELINEAAKLYALRFTEQELTEVLAFYKTPLGRKVVSQEPAILDESLQNAKNWANRLSEEIIGKFRAEMKKKGHEI
jgi:hypothetical protein